MRRALGVVITLNAVAVIVAALTGNLPTWPPGQHDVHIPDQTGTPLWTFAGRDNITDLGVIAVWNDISISNSLFTMWIVMGLLVVLALLASRGISETPGRFQNLMETIIEALQNFMREAGGSEVVRFLPLFGTLFLLILFSNWLGVVPLVGQIELLHSPTADYHINLGLAVTAFAMYQYAGIRKNKLGYFTRWIDFTGFKDGMLVGPVMVLVGIIELFSELFRILTLTLRLWGNIWGGEIVLAVLTALLFVPSFPLPFIGLELFIGFIQAFVFAFLVLLYIILALESHGDEHHAEESHEGPREAAHAAA